MRRTTIPTTALLMALASPLAAQDLCGGKGAGGQWVGGSEESSDITTTEAYQEQMALVLGGNAYVGLFSLSEPTEVRIEAAGRGGGDPLIEVFDAAGGIVATDDDSGGGGAARSEVSLEAGTYCVNMKPYDSGPMTAFLRVGRMDQEPLAEGSSASGEGTSPSNDCSAATPMGEIGAVNAASVDETSHWSFTLSEPTAITITANGDGADPTIALYDSDGTTLAENDDFDGLNSRITQSNPLPAGDYCIGMGALSDTSVPIATTVTVYDAAAELAALYARGEAAPPLDGSVAVTAMGEITSRSRQDIQVGSEVAWFSMDIADSSLILIEAIAAGDGGDPWLVIYDDLGRKVGENDDNDGLNSLLTARVQKGTYIFGVKQVGDSQGFVRLLVERYVPAE
jgi:hypothetical protein